MNKTLMKMAIQRARQLKGAELRAFVDAALDVACESPYPDLRQAALEVLRTLKIERPELITYKDLERAVI